MLSISELRSHAASVVSEAQKYQGVINAIDMGLDEDDLELFFPWVGKLKRPIPEVQHQSDTDDGETSLTGDGNMSIEDTSCSCFQ